MAIANLALVLIVLGCAAYQYKKGTFMKSLAMVMTIICSTVVAFNYFEMLANVIISHVSSSSSMLLWAQPLSFILLFVLAFGILQTIAAQLTRQPVNVGILTERIGRVVCGILSGVILSGVLLTALAMAPLPTNYPYPRFDQNSPQVEKPQKVLFNTDGFTTGWFSILSSGSFKGKRSFATLHPAFLDQVFLNRQEIANDIPIVTTSDAIKMPDKAAWPSEGLKNPDGNPVTAKSQHTLTTVRVGINKAAITKDEMNVGRFTFSQLRLICKQKSHTKDPLGGRGEAVYPIGYINSQGRLEKKRLEETMRIERGDYEDGKSVKYIDFVFEVPSDSTPVLVQFKQNIIAEVATAQQAPQQSPLVEPSGI